jgi:SpoVK/Ycf46/Vps4 family AAA+-type ATPase
MARRSQLRHNHHKQTTPPKLDSETGKYIPLFGSYLIEISLALDWYQPTSNQHWPDIFNDFDFCAMTGMTRIEDGDEDSSQLKKVMAAQCRKVLIKQLEHLHKMKLSPNLTLFKNIYLLAELLNFNASDQAILTFVTGLYVFPEFSDAIRHKYAKMTTRSLCILMSRLTGINERELQRSFAQDGTLISSGLVNLIKGSCDLEDKVRLMDGLGDVMLTPHKKVDDLVALFMRRATAPTLSLKNFPHMSKDWELLEKYLGNAITGKSKGVNVLVYGKPGVGKNEFVQALAKELNVDLYEVSYTDEDGDPIKGQARLQAYALCQRLLARNQNAMLLFDEAEDIWDSGGKSFSKMFADDDEEQSDINPIGKAWINRVLENNPVPAIWISNRVGQIDKAYLRRFDYSVSFTTPPHRVRTNIARHHLNCFDPPQSWIEKLAANESIVPAQFERAAKVASIAALDDNSCAMDLVEQTLDRSITLLGQRRAPSRNILRTGYSLEWLNTDLPIESLVEGVKRRPRGTFCFYGAPGTGKSELARYISGQIGKPMILKRASDILSKWVGDSEKNIAGMFTEARQQDALLVLDEADSFLSDRRDAVRSWEVTQVNELLTQIEAFEGIFVCTTNLISRLDQASLRRFAFKVRFDPLKPDQRVAMFRQELVRLGGDVTGCLDWEPLISRMEQLTPGDFAVASRQFEMWDEPASSGRLYEVLKKECEAKESAPKKIGFGAAE